MKNKIDKIETLVYIYRKAIERALRDRRFDSKDRFSGFPIGCCDDTCDLLGQYLLENDIRMACEFAAVAETVAMLRTGGVANLPDYEDIRRFITDNELDARLLI